MIRVMVVDDHQLVRSGLDRLLTTADDFDVVASVGNGAEALDTVAESRPDVILMDLSMPRMGGIEATRRLMELDASLRIVILTSFSEREQLADAIDAGALGYLLKDSEPEDLFRGVRAAARGESPLDPRVARLLMRSPTTGPSGRGLTARETQVLELVARGHSNKEIARSLRISEKTVKSHLTKVFQRLDVVDRTQAALWARERGIGTGE